jgi:hypothetical protein
LTPAAKRGTQVIAKASSLGSGISSLRLGGNPWHLAYGLIGSQSHTPEVTFDPVADTLVMRVNDRSTY